MSHTVARLAAALAVVAALAAPAAAAWEIAPHRAIYQLDMGSARMGSQVSDVDGQMLFLWEESCDGWTVEQRYRTRYLFAEGGEVDQWMTYATWESKDGRDFNFTVRNATGGMTDEEIRGVAEIGGDGTGRVDYRIPESHAEALPSGTLFPTAHTLRLLQEAEDGGRFFVSYMFDGTEVDGLSEISAVIGDRQPGPKEAENALLSRPFWPVQLAFFSLSEGGSEPDYEMSVTLYDNGVIDSMLIDYGDFTVRATLAELEALDRPDCP
ncbi:MAG: cell envelope integrity EipB family protein [Inquilinus sp.]|nr:cell envelope integrity EipB family protein [Inquilinus sp.]